jgi:hypothetical protein
MIPMKTKGFADRNFLEIDLEGKRIKRLVAIHG